MDVLLNCTQIPNKHELWTGTVTFICIIISLKTQRQRRRKRTRSTEQIGQVPCTSSCLGICHVYNITAVSCNQWCMPAVVTREKNYLALFSRMVLLLFKCLYRVFIAMLGVFMFLAYLLLFTTTVHMMFILLCVCLSHLNS